MAFFITNIHGTHHRHQVAHRRQWNRPVMPGPTWTPSKHGSQGCSPSVACETDSETPQQGEVNRVPALLCQKSVKSMSIRSSFRLVRSADIGRLYFLRFT